MVRAAGALSTLPELRFRIVGSPRSLALEDPLFLSLASYHLHMSHNTKKSTFELSPLLPLLTPSPLLLSSFIFFFFSTQSGGTPLWCLPHDLTKTPPSTVAASFVLARHISGLALPGLVSGVVHCCSVASRQTASAQPTRDPTISRLQTACPPISSDR
ncbi:hypothetical protein B0J13DRAFT_568587, partial [Dactylonectria estremocensis]